jgi:uncharacterized membrane protein
MDREANRKLLVRSGLLFGVGLGGFFDGIVLHQILQWHHFVSSVGRYPTSTIDGLEGNTLWDGLFHVLTWVAVVVALWLLWRAARVPHDPWSTKLLAGLLLMGWGAFNLVDGTVNHFMLSIHHIRENTSNKAAWDLGFMVLGAAMLVGGWLLARRGDAKEDAATDRSSRSIHPVRVAWDRARSRWSRCTSSAAARTSWTSCSTRARCS